MRRLLTRKRIIIVLSVAIVLAVPASVGIGLALRSAVTTLTTHSEDTGRQACRMMNDDKKNGATPDDARSQQELTLLAKSGNANLREAAILIPEVTAGSAIAAADALSKLYNGCYEVGVSIV